MFLGLHKHINFQAILQVPFYPHLTAWAKMSLRQAQNISMSAKINFE